MNKETVKDVVLKAAFLGLALVGLYVVFNVAKPSEASVVAGSNLVLNPSFEQGSNNCEPIDGSKVPNINNLAGGLREPYVTSWPRVVDGYDAVSGWPGNSRPDYANNLKASCVQHCEDHFGGTGCINYANARAIPSNGDAMAGSWMYDQQSEYFQGSLASALVPGKTYQLSFDIIAADMSSIGATVGGSSDWHDYAGNSLTMGVDFYQDALLVHGTSKGGSNPGVSITPSANIVNITKPLPKRLLLLMQLNISL